MSENRCTLCGAKEKISGAVRVVPMSEIDREKLEQWLDAEIQNKDWPHEVRFGFLQVKKEIQSGAFDLRETEKEEYDGHE